MIPARKAFKNDVWAIEYTDPNDGLVKDLITRPTEEEIDGIASTILKDENDQPIKDEDDNIKTMIYPFYLE